MRHSLLAGVAMLALVGFAWAGGKTRIAKLPSCSITTEQYQEAMRAVGDEGLAAYSAVPTRLWLNIWNVTGSDKIPWRADSMLVFHASVESHSGEHDTFRVAFFKDGCFVGDVHVAAGDFNDAVEESRKGMEV